MEVQQQYNHRSVIIIIGQTQGMNWGEEGAMTAS